MARRHGITRPLLAELLGVAKPLAARHPTMPVSPAIHAQANTLLHHVRRILSREPFPRDLLRLSEVPDWSTLLARLELAMAGLQAFRSRYSAFDEELQDYVWHDEAWLSFDRDRAKSGSAPSDFHDF
jgi:hypothetical protein